MNHFVLFYLIDIAAVLLAHDPSLAQRAYRATIIAARLGKFSVFEAGQGSDFM
jgi:hypothetical protein